MLIVRRRPARRSGSSQLRVACRCRGAAASARLPGSPRALRSRQGSPRGESALRACPRRPRASRRGEAVASPVGRRTSGRSPPRQPSQRSHSARRRSGSRYRLEAELGATGMSRRGCGGRYPRLSRQRSERPLRQWLAGEIESSGLNRPRKSPVESGLLLYETLEREVILNARSGRRAETRPLTRLGQQPCQRVG
jgi:hypothetical protein